MLSSIIDETCACGQRGIGDLTASPSPAIANTSSTAFSVPLAFFAGRAIFGRTTGLVCALLAALDPFLTYYAQETRMYELEAFLSLLVAYAYVQGVIRGRRLWAVALAGIVAPVRSDGMAVRAGLVPPRRVLLALMLAVPGIVPLAVSHLVPVTASLFVGQVFLWWLARFLRRRIGGSTGDCLGFAAYMGQLVMLLAVAA